MGRPHITLHDKNLSPVGHCLCDTGASVSMLISNQQLEILHRKNMVNYVYTYSERETEEQKLTTYSQGAAQPYIKSVAGITFEIIIEEQDNPHANTTQSMTINCSVVHNASKPDFHCYKRIDCHSRGNQRSNSMLNIVTSSKSLIGGDVYLFLRGPRGRY